MDNLIEYSKHVFATKVVQQFVCLATEFQRNQTMQIICDLDEWVLYHLCNDECANDVVLQLIKIATPDQIDTIYLKIVTHLHKEYTFVRAHRIMKKLKLHRKNRVRRGLPVTYELLWV